jgi:hypothetical protein
MPNKYASDGATVATVDRGGFYCCEVCPTHQLGRMNIHELAAHLKAAHGLTTTGD